MQPTAKQPTQPDDFLSALEGLIIIDPLLMTPTPQSIVKPYIDYKVSVLFFVLKLVVCFYVCCIYLQDLINNNILFK